MPTRDDARDGVDGSGDDARDASEEMSREMHGTRPRLRSQGRDDARSVKTMSHRRD